MVCREGYSKWSDLKSVCCSMRLTYVPVFQTSLCDNTIKLRTSPQVLPVRGGLTNSPAVERWCTMRAASTVTITPVGGPSPLGPAHHRVPSAPAVSAILTAAKASAARFQRSEASENGSQGRAPSTLQQGHTQTRVMLAVGDLQARGRHSPAAGAGCCSCTDSL